MVTVEADAIHISDGRLRTAAGVTAGLDMALALVEEDHWRTVALRVAKQLILFLKRTRYPGGLIDFVETNRGDLDHLLYDVGIDYVKTANGLEIVKSAFYGLL